MKKQQGGSERTISERTVSRLILYRKRLSGAHEHQKRFIYSYELGAMCGVSSAQVRRDLMLVGCAGSPNRGYDRRELLAGIEEFLYRPGTQNVALVGLGNLGRAILSFFAGRRSRLAVVATFDIDSAKTNCVTFGCRCYPVADLRTVAAAARIEVAMLTVPAAAAQATADLLVDAGVRGILNFAPVTLRVPDHVFVEDIDLAMSLEKVAFFARRGQQMERKHA
ncbi:MAG TPA: redox-sensing transcriptional repressor Rex [Planctomycetota bacterium]|jgi:redox-sensing transcriptional repressor|nr:redox-sensing transcriptional repressor Rex [Planctomycetota bacterium]OQC20708.1 MAG: Redox-sensing transcriptional repressor Rex [Planctomycetes bacterium ADurb.Bin069]NMD35584.1 redox-sensing transcriptional repressor Rex [Planctomycetota bacterium]HNR98319.1 redox-sensing transcriptional repressor Rex [Planctomycetota bacterium]HNU24637.1 redox-sensing transcriptional repressor Rex [Planctomycetota bacterium]